MAAASRPTEIRGRGRVLRRDPDSCRAKTAEIPIRRIRPPVSVCYDRRKCNAGPPKGALRSLKTKDDLLAQIRSGEALGPALPMRAPVARSTIVRARKGVKARAG